MANTKLLIEDTDHEYDISKEDILIYAQQIGINTSTEKNLIWIAEKGLAANVPKPWSILSDEKDRIFYYNVETNEKSWRHPLDKEYAALVSEERTKSKSLNSASSDYGFESKPLNSLNDPSQSSGRFPKAPPQQLSSLADAPPLSSSGRNSPPPLKRGKKEGSLSGRKFEFGHIENKRGTQLAPVRLNTMKMPAAPTPKSGGGMSFMPRGATLSKNIRRVKEEADYENELEEDRLDYGHPPPDDSNESLNSDEGSKYSYEETDEEEKNIHGLDPYMLDASQLSPMHSADESPDALDINSLVQLGTKLPSRFDISMKKEQINVNKESSPSLNLRKVGQPSVLKPLAQTSKKKNTFKGSKAAKKGSAKNKYPSESDLDFEDKISVINDEQRLMLEQIQKEWLTMQDELEKQEKEKYEEMLKDSLMKLEEEEIKLRNENAEKLSKIKNELQKKIEDEQSAADKNLQSIKESNKEKINEEEKKFQKELETLSESFKTEIKKVQEKNDAELTEKKKELEEVSRKEIDSLKVKHDSDKKIIEDTHITEISKLQKTHKEKIEEIQSAYEKEAEIKNREKESVSKKDELQDEIQNLQKIIKEETDKYKNLLQEKENILKEITIEKDNLEKAKKETVETQAGIEELQEEVEKTENDLDLMRTEKSALISELNILKENINNEKSNLLNLENKLKSNIKETSSSQEFSEIGTNTDVSFLDTFCKSVQVSISCRDFSCQMENVIVPVTDATCQTSSPGISSCKSCQTEIVPYVAEKLTVKTASDKAPINSNTVADKNLENALSGLSMKLDSRINVIEHQLRLIQENISKPSATQPVSYSEEFIQNQFTEVKTVPNSEMRNIPSLYSTDSAVPSEFFSANIPSSSQNKCKCEVGDSASCNVLQDVKNSVYRLNDILCNSYVPPLSGGSLYQVKQPMSSYSSPFDSFYSQLREMQEKHRLTELKQRCENEALKLTKSSTTNTTDAKRFGNLSETESLKPSYHLMHSSSYSYNMPEDPFIRARSIVLREQARAWKDQQSLNSSFPHVFSMNALNSSSECSQSSVTGFTTTRNNVPSSQQTFLKFDVDPETDYNMWMTRLNALQLRIRSHKMS